MTKGERNKDRSEIGEKHRSDINTWGELDIGGEICQRKGIN